MAQHDFDRHFGISRRDLIKRGAVVGGTLVWATPVVQRLTPPAFAAGTTCDCFFCAETSFGTLKCVPNDPNDCNCVCECADPSVDFGCTKSDPCNVSVTCTPDPDCSI